jgi:hypothetical protein
MDPSSSLNSPTVEAFPLASLRNRISQEHMQEVISTLLQVLLAQWLLDPNEDLTAVDAQGPGLDRDPAAAAPSRPLAKDPPVPDTRHLRQYAPLNTLPNTNTNLHHNKHTNNKDINSIHRTT